MTPATFSYDPEAERLRIAPVVPRFDASVAAAFRDSLAGQWPQGTLRQVEVDLSAVEFIDSSGIGSLIAISKKLGRQGEPVALCNVHPQVRSVIELLRLQSLFRVV